MKLESAGSMSLERARRSLTKKGIRERLDQAERVFRHYSAHEPDPEADELRREVLEDGERLLQRLRQEGPLAAFKGRERAKLEALVLLHGRPAIPIKNGKLDLTAPEVDEWRGWIEMALPEIERVLGKVGRIDGDGEHIGTGFVVAEGVVMTNRHVVEAFATPVPRRRNPSALADHERPGHNQLRRDRG